MPSYEVFRRGVDVAQLDLPAGQLIHVLRHTFASYYMMNGGDIIMLQTVLRHSTLAMTQKYERCIGVRFFQFHLNCSRKSSMCDFLY